MRLITYIAHLSYFESLLELVENKSSPGRERQWLLLVLMPHYLGTQAAGANISIPIVRRTSHSYVGNGPIVLFTTRIRY